MAFNTINQEAKITGIPHSRIRTWIKSGEVKIPYFMAGSRHYINHEQFVTVINEMCKSTANDCNKDGSGS